jgi:hypothetical protein
MLDPVWNAPENKARREGPYFLGARRGDRFATERHGQ